RRHRRTATRKQQDDGRSFATRAAARLLFSNRLRASLQPRRRADGDSAENRLAARMAGTGGSGGGSFVRLASEIPARLQRRQAPHRGGDEGRAGNGRTRTAADRADAFAPIETRSRGDEESSQFRSGPPSPRKRL